MSTRPPGEEPGTPSERDGESAPAPPIPSFDSLRGPRRHSPMDVLLSGPPPAAPDPQPGRTTAARPPEYADLVRLGVRVLRSVAGVPVRVAWWSVRLPVRGAQRLLGDRAEQPR